MDIWRYLIWGYLKVLFMLCGLISLTAVNAAKLPGVEILKTAAISHNKISLSWKPVFTPKKGNLKYIIRFKEDQSRFQRVISSIPKVSLKTLKPDTLYTIAVRAFKGKDRGIWSKSTTVKTLPKTATKQDLKNLRGNVTVQDVEATSAFISWTMGIDLNLVDDFEAFMVIWRHKKKKLEGDVTNQNMTLTDLDPKTRYVVNVYLLLKTGLKIKVGNVKFLTGEEEITAPKNFKVKSLTDTTIEVKWRRFDRDNPDSKVSGYLLEYKVKGELNTCFVNLNRTERNFLFEGLQPDTKYGIRLAGMFDHVTGPFADWLKIKTEPFDEGKQNIRIYHISSREILVLWSPTDGYQFRVLDMFDTGTSLQKHIYHKEFPAESDPESAEFVNELDPATTYKLMISEYTTVDSYRTQPCPRRQIGVFTTGDCETNCKQHKTPFSADIKGNFYDPYLRLLSLPDEKSNLITWSAYTDYVSNSTFFYIIKVLGEPFLSHLHSYLIPIGRTYHVIDGLDPEKPYSISLLVFDTKEENPLFMSEYLLLLPVKDMPFEFDVESNKNEDILTVNSMDFYHGSPVSNIHDDLLVQQLDGFNLSLISKLYLDDAFDTAISTNDTVSDIVNFLDQVQPEVYTIENVTVQEGEMVDITCLSRGDPFPMITWINLTANESISNVNSSQRVFTNLPQYVGSVRPIDSRSFMGMKSFLTIQHAKLSDTGQYACAAENPPGIDMGFFHITVLPEPPGPIQNLISSAPTPFEIRVSWQPPNQTPDVLAISPVVGYRLELLDKYNVMMGERNVTIDITSTNDVPNNVNNTDNNGSLNSVFTNLLPNTFYKIVVYAYHKYGEGVRQQTESKTRRIPILGPAENVTVVTLNSTIVQITWEDPLVVSTNQIRLRKYIIHLRKDGDRKSEERHIDKNVTEVIFLNLIAEQYYKFRIIGMSEDGQVSYSEWIEGSTYREAYMEENQPPPPPYNVYLRPDTDNIIVSWLPPRNDDNIIVRGYAITVLNNGTKRESMEVGYKESSVIIYEVDMGVIYQISVQAKNNAGTSLEQWAELYIPEIRVTDQPVENFRGRVVSSTNVQLQWDPPGSGVYSHFILSYSTSEGKTAKLPDRGILPEHVRSYVVRTLKPYTEYIFQITPYFKRMKGVSANITITTLPDRPSKAPENIVLTSFNSTAILIECQPPSKGKNGIIVTYKVSYRTKRTWRNDVIFSAEDDESLNQYVTGLLPSTKYEFRVRAITAIGSGPWSSWLSIRTKSPDPIMPKVPQNLTSESTKTAIALSWKPPDQDIGHITGYVIGYGKFIPEAYRASVTKETNTYIIENLDPDSMYIISVRSFNEYGESAAIFEVISTLSET